MTVVVDMVHARVVRSLRQTVPLERSIRGDSHLGRDLGMDSLAMMELVLDLEDLLDVSIPLERVARVATVDDLVAALKHALYFPAERCAA